MGKSYRSDKSIHSENRSKKNEYKRKKSRICEENDRSEFSDYKIHGFKNNK